MAEPTEIQSENVKASGAETLELAEAVIISGPLKGKLVTVRVTLDGKFAKVTPQFTLEEMEILRAYEASKKEKAEAFVESESSEAAAEKLDVTADHLSPANPTDN